MHLSLRFNYIALLASAAFCACNTSPRSQHIAVAQGALVAQLTPGVTAAATRDGQTWVVGLQTGELLLSTPQEKRIELLDATGNCPAAVKNQYAVAPPKHDGAISTIVLSRDGQHFLSIGGRSAIWWDINRKKMLRQIAGPHLITAATLDTGNSGDDTAAFLGTELGHVLRWDFAQGEAMEVTKFSCPGSTIAPDRMKLDSTKRCPAGTYVKNNDGIAICTYRVTQLLLTQESQNEKQSEKQDTQLLRACREGTLGALRLKDRSLRWQLSGHVLTLTQFDATRVLFGRADGQLQLFDLNGWTPSATLEPPGRPTAAASMMHQVTKHNTTPLTAVAQADRIRFWIGTALAGAVKIPSPARAIYLQATPLQLGAVLQDGRIVRHALTIK